MNQWIATVASASGGHIIPCLTLIEKELKKNPTLSVLFLSGISDLDQSILNTFPYITQRINLHIIKVPYKKIWLWPLFFTQNILLFFKSLYALQKHRPIKIISTGGYLAIPVCLAAKLLWIPIYLYELNVIPGKTVSFLTPLAKKTFICFTAAQRYFKSNVLQIKYPLRFTEAHKNYDPQKILKELSFNPQQKTVLILGGSQGSQFLNNQIRHLLSTGNHYNIIHQTGSSCIAQLEQFYNNRTIPAVVFAYNQNLAPYYCVADIIICRSGAGTLFESAFFKKPCITIPLEIKSNNHQVENAYGIQEQYPHYFYVLRQQALETDSELLAKTIQRLLVQPM